MKLAAKEFRALIPVWAAAAFTIGADTWLPTGMHRVYPVGMFAYIVGIARARRSRHRA